VAQLRALQRPHIFLILVDTLRADALTPYGAPAEVTPELMRWAEHGVVFEGARAQSSWTKISMASMMTSLWPRSHGVAGIRDALASDASTLAERMQEGGYRTYGVQSNGWLEQTFGFQQGFERYVFARGSAPAWMRSMVWPHAENVFHEVERLIDTHDPEEPLFLYMHLMDVHEYAAPVEFKRFGNDTRGAYRAAVHWVDRVLQRLREKLDERGLLDRSVIILASDHAESFGENRSEGHAKHVFTPILRVPLVLRLPTANAPIRISQQVRNLDIAPTVLDLAGLAIPDTYQGRSLLPLLGRESDPRDRVTYASLSDLLYRDARRQESVSDGSWSFARDLDGGRNEYLFDHGVDPDEDVNLIEFEPARAEVMRALLDAYEAQKPTPGTVAPEVRIDPSLAAKLKALGYLQE
jgi:arylsulfatase A-like enzyme